MRGCDQSAGIAIRADPVVSTSASMALGHPGLLQEIPHIAALLPEAGADREQACAQSAPGLD
jgi:hypothetical protein